MKRLNVRANVIGGMKGRSCAFSGSNISHKSQTQAVHLPRFLEKEPNQVKGKATDLNFPDCR